MPKQQTTVTPVITFDKMTGTSTRIRITNGEFAERVLAAAVVDIPWELFTSAMANRDQDIEEIARDEGFLEGRKHEQQLRSGQVPITTLPPLFPSPSVAGGQGTMVWYTNGDPESPLSRFAAMRAAEDRRAQEIVRELSSKEDQHQVLKEDDHGNREWVTSED